MAAPIPAASVERVNSKANSDVVFVVRRGASLREHLQECGTQHFREMEIGYRRFAPQLQFALEKHDPTIMVDLTVALKCYYTAAIIALLKAGIVHVVGMKDHPVSGGEFANTASAELIEEAHTLIVNRIRELDEPAGQGVVVN